MKDSGIQGCSEPGPRASSERKCSPFNLTFSLLRFLFSFFGVSFFPHQDQGELAFFFLSSHTSTCTPALARGSLVGDGWMDGWMDGWIVRRRTNWRDSKPFWAFSYNFTLSFLMMPLKTILQEYTKELKLCLRCLGNIDFNILCYCFYLIREMLRENWQR